MIDICGNRLFKAVSEVGVWLDSMNVPLYRELVEVLQMADTVSDTIGLSKIPHYTTFKKFAARFPCRIFYQMIQSVAKHICQGTLNLSIDSTGFSLDTSSRYYSHRIKRLERHRSYVKTTLVIDTKTQAVASVKPRLKIRHDLVDAAPTPESSQTRKGQICRSRERLRQRGPFEVHQMGAGSQVCNITEVPGQTAQQDPRRFEAKPQTTFPNKVVPPAEQKRISQQPNQTNVRQHHTSQTKPHQKNRNPAESVSPQPNTQKANRGFLQSFLIFIYVGILEYVRVYCLCTPYWNTNFRISLNDNYFITSFCNCLCCH